MNAEADGGTAAKCRVPTDHFASNVRFMPSPARSRRAKPSTVSSRTAFCSQARRTFPNIVRFFISRFPRPGRQPPVRQISAAPATKARQYRTRLHISLFARARAPRPRNMQAMPMMSSSRWIYRHHAAIEYVSPYAAGGRRHFICNVSNMKWRTRCRRGEYLAPLQPLIEGSQPQPP